ncbi:MAG: hypothetical protein HC877_17635 [Thioploca sp.]|nr:hypothetical protein [Thioploca sp.]
MNYPSNGSTQMNTLKTLIVVVSVFSLSINSQAETEYAQIPDYSGVTTSSTIVSNQAFLYQNLGFNPNVMGSANELVDTIANALGVGGISGGELAIVDNVYNPQCVAYLQYNQGNNANQNLTATNINLNCR